MNIAFLLRGGLVLFAFLQVSRGVLLIETAPQVEVLWEGVSLGHTDTDGRLRIRDIPPGSYVLTLRGEQWVEERRAIEIAAGLRRLRVDLAPSSVASQAVPTVVAGQSRAAAPPPGRVATPDKVAAKPPPPAVSAQSVEPAAELVQAPRPAVQHQLALPIIEDPQLGPARVRSSQVARSESSPFSSLLFLAIGILLGVTLWLLRSSRPGQPTASEFASSYPEANQFEPPPDDDPRIQTTSFLAEIRAREHQMADGIEVLSPHQRRTISVDPERVRVVEEESD